MDIVEEGFSESGLGETLSDAQKNKLKEVKQKKCKCLFNVV